MDSSLSCEDDWNRLIFLCLFGTLQLRIKRFAVRTIKIAVDASIYQQPIQSFIYLIVGLHFDAHFSSFHF